MIHGILVTSTACWGRGRGGAAVAVDVAPLLPDSRPPQSMARRLGVEFRTAQPRYVLKGTIDAKVFAMRRLVTLRKMRVLVHGNA
ncbi:hypothetical protein RR46_06097 [Papilio xuthus]|uniref:Uncharacterized protein n=1 Tax=Papilio xuthus TaxID=66420 RepID=A0A194QEA9_PAPXU|nr:hypothetical protein RR46_06097 [Papilio xuthus]